MPTLPVLKPGDTVELIAPASRCSEEQLTELQNLLTSWQLNCIVSKNIFGNDFLCANTDEIRFELLKKALENPRVKAVFCVRGGYGSMRLIPQLASMVPPVPAKLFVGMSDITALNLFFEQHWRWPTLHSGAALPKRFSAESIAAFKSIIFGEIEKIGLDGVPLNRLAEQNQVLETSITGGNLCLIQTGIGTIWQMNGRNKIVFLEDTGERGYRIDRMLEHLSQANLFKNATAILLGDFIQGEEPNGSSLVNPVLERFAQACAIPVVQIKGIGHGHTSFPVPLGTMAKLHLGKVIKLECFR